MAVYRQWGIFLAALSLTLHANGQVFFEDNPRPSQPTRPQQPTANPNQGQNRPQPPRNNNCQTFRNEPGTCIRLSDCGPINNLLANRPPFQANRILRRSICGSTGFAPLVCCPGVGNDGGNPSIPVPPPTPAPIPTTTTTPRPTTRPAPPAPVPGPSAPNRRDVPTVPGTNIECGFSNATHKRIVGGHDAEKGAWPWMAALGYKDADTGGVNFLCGGALVSDQHVVTASHCVHNRNDLAIIRFGDLNLFTDDDGVTPVDVPVAEIIKNPNYNPTTFVNDIAVIKLKEKVPMSLLVHPICLPTSPEQRSNLYENNNPFVAGWGAVQFNGPTSVTLREVQLPVVSNSVCQEKYKPFKSSQVDDTNICAGFARGGKDACQGDSGGPLMMPQPGQRYILIGVVSYGFRCAEPGFPGVYSRVTSHVDWIIDTMKNK